MLVLLLRGRGRCLHHLRNRRQVHNLMDKLHPNRVYNLNNLNNNHSHNNNQLNLLSHLLNTHPKPKYKSLIRLNDEYRKTRLRQPPMLTLTLTRIQTRIQTNQVHDRYRHIHHSKNRFCQRLTMKLCRGEERELVW